VSGTLFSQGAVVWHSVIGRVRRVDVGGVIYHALNRANFRSVPFQKEAHDQDFLALVAEGADVVPMRLLAYCVMSNRWKRRVPDTLS
jgi:putative transposase